MKKIFLSLVFLPLVVSNSSRVETVIRAEATGENASVKTEITNIVNGEVTHLESTCPGEIKVEVKNGEVNVESDTEVPPTIDYPDEQEVKDIQPKALQPIENIKNKVFSFISGLFSRVLGIFRFSS